MSLSQLLLYLTIIVYLTLLGINQQDLTWLQTALRYNVAWLKVHNANLTGHNHHPTFSDGVTAWAQTITI